MCYPDRDLWLALDFQNLLRLLAMARRGRKTEEMWEHDRNQHILIKITERPRNLKDNEKRATSHERMMRASRTTLLDNRQQVGLKRKAIRREEMRETISKERNVNPRIAEPDIDLGGGDDQMKELNGRRWYQAESRLRTAMAYPACLHGPSSPQINHSPSLPRQFIYEFQEHGESTDLTGERPLSFLPPLRRTSLATSIVPLVRYRPEDHVTLMPKTARAKLK